MATSSTSAWRQLQDLIGNSARVQSQWASAVLAATRAAGRSEGVSTGDLLAKVGSEYVDYAREVARINLEYARTLQQLSIATGERLTDAVDVPGRAASAARTVARAAADASDASEEAGRNVAGRSATKKTATRRSTTKKTAARKSPAVKRTAARKTSAAKKSAARKAAKRPARARRTPLAQG